MALSRIEPGPGGADLRTFECPKCEHIQRVVAADPLKSDKAAGMTANSSRHGEACMELS
jgi:hypothetical protein